MVKAIQQIAQNSIDYGKPVIFLFGTVETVHPLTIRIDQNMLLKERELLLTDAVRDYKTMLSFDNAAIKNKVQIGNRPLAKDAALTTKPDTPEEESCPAILKGDFSFAEQVQHEVTIYNSLKKGEGVILLRVQGGQRFLVLDRTEARK